MIAFGRLIGWGSNQSHQLGDAERKIISKPHEMIFNSAVQQCVCGPESTLVLTEDSRLYLTGRLNEFEFVQFTELQKNLSPTEQIIFMYISQANEIFIVTNTGSIYRSYESQRNRNLIFQRYYDYDSEEYGPIWKLLKGNSFCAVLTKTNKFYTTFSESGHHLKTFREISKFKNLRILDIALGVQHVLVHGIPRTSAQVPHTALSSIRSSHYTFNEHSYYNLNGNTTATNHNNNNNTNNTINNNNSYDDRIENGNNHHLVHSTSQDNGIEIKPESRNLTNERTSTATISRDNYLTTNDEIQNSKDEFTNNNINMELETSSPTDSFASRQSTCTIKALLKNTGNSMTNGDSTEEIRERPTTKTISKKTSQFPTAIMIDQQNLNDTSPAVLQENEKNLLKKIDGNIISNGNYLHIM